MKYFLLSLTVTLLINANAFCQTPRVQRRVRFNFIGRTDSVNLALNEDFDVIEDSCSQVIRYGHLNMQKRIFTGRVKDVLRSDPKLVLTEGSYNNEGLKDGLFTAYFFNGQLQAKGNFKNGQYDGDWAIYYDDGKPRIKFKATGDDLTITDAWDTNGKKIVDNGKGNYRADAGIVYWKGKILDGKPDGTWHAIKTDDASNTDLATENYKNGILKKGNGPTGEYTISRIKLISPNMLPFTNAEHLHISAVPCNGAKWKHVVNAQYSNGLQGFSQEISTLVTPYINTIDIKEFDNMITLDGYISESGAILGLTSSGTFREDVARGIIYKLRQLPSLVPATVDGKPVKQKMTITFTFLKGFYSFSYRFLPIELK